MEGTLLVPELSSVLLVAFDSSPCVGSADHVPLKSTRNVGRVYYNDDAP